MAKAPNTISSARRRSILYSDMGNMLGAYDSIPERPMLAHGFNYSPGRFFAVNELKIMLAHVLMHYDVKFAQEGVRPPNKYFSEVVMPDMKAEVMFRKRRA